MVTKGNVSTSILFIWKIEFGNQNYDFFYSVYSLKPNKGLLSPSEHQLFVVKCQPSEVKTYKNTLQLRLNYLDKNTQVCLHSYYITFTFLLIINQLPWFNYVVKFRCILNIGDSDDWFG